MSEKKPEEKQGRKPAYPQQRPPPQYLPPSPPLPPPQMPPSSPPYPAPPTPQPPYQQQYPAYSPPYQPPQQYGQPQPPPPSPYTTQTYQPPPPRPPPSRTAQQPRVEELTPGIGKVLLYLGIPLILIGIVALITYAVLFPSASDVYMPYSSIAFMIALITIAAALIVNFIAMYEITSGLDKRFEYILRTLRQQTTQPAVAPQTAPQVPQYSAPQYSQPMPGWILTPAPRRFPPQRPQIVQPEQKPTPPSQGEGETAQEARREREQEAPPSQGGEEPAREEQGGEGAQ